MGSADDGPFRRHPLPRGNAVIFFSGRFLKGFGVLGGKLGGISSRNGPRGVILGAWGGPGGSFWEPGRVRGGPCGSLVGPPPHKALEFKGKISLGRGHLGSPVEPGRARSKPHKVSITMDVLEGDMVRLLCFAALRAPPKTEGHEVL